MKYFLLMIIFINSLFSEDSLVCSTDSIANRDFSYKNNVWGDGIELDVKNSDFGIANKENPKGELFKNYEFSKLDTLHPTIKSITVYEDGQEFIKNFEGKIIHTSENLLLIQWNTVDYNLWIATINIKHKKATISNHYDGIHSFGISATSLNCK